MTKEKRKIVLILLLHCSIVLTSQNIQFTNMEDLPEARSALTSANNGTDIFIVNGFGADEQYTDEIFQYNIAQNSWSTLTSSTLPKRFASAEIVGNYLYVFNGVAENGLLNNRVEKVDLNDGSIQYLSDNPHPSRAAGVTTWNNKIYSFGGILTPNEYSNKLYEFDPTNDTWTELTDIPFAGETKGEIIDGKLYIIGGYNGTVSNRIDVYNLSTGIWESNFVMPVEISAHSTTVIGKKIYLVGDFSNLTLIAYFDTFDNGFQTLTNNLIERRHCAAEGVDGHLFAIGGNTTSSIQSSISSVQKADIITSINEVANVQSIEVYPNPSANTFNLNMQFDELYIYDNQGKQVLRFTKVADVDISKLNRGTYFIKGYIGSKLYQAKFLKI